MNTILFIINAFLNLFEIVLQIYMDNYSKCLCVYVAFFLLCLYCIKVIRLYGLTEMTYTSWLS